MGTLQNFVKASVLGLGAVAIATSANAITFGSNTVYKVTDNGVTSVFISATANSEIQINLGETTRSSAKMAGTCGEVKISPPSSGQLTSVMVGTRTIDASILPVQLLPKCINGQFEEARTEDFKTSTGQVVAVGFTPNQAVTVGIPTPTVRKVKANGCGFGTIRNASGSFAINGQNYDVATLPDAGEAPLCRSSNGMSTGYVPANW